mmetsp:Transcript_2306/g.5914  ORF Transcript_2306/g.5914 Transcript_2306/m.5914 type:complete len:925 (+) Transcript_2306:104-2878(+)
MPDDELLSASVLRQIGHAQYDKRKIAALEVEQTVKRLSKSHDDARVQKVVDKLIAEYAFSPQANHRKGALLCLAAATVGLGTPTEAHLRQIVPPVLASFTDQDGRVRYYACEALYNIAKVAREPFIIFFNEVFDAMFRLCADAEANVLNAVQFLDNLVKDIIAASPASFNMAGFVPKLRDYLRVAHPNKRMFLVSWITVLDSVPDLDLLVYLPQLLDGLMAMLSDPNREIRVAAHKAMMEFLIEIHATQNVDFASMAVSLVDKATSPDEFTRMTAIKWLKEFVEMAAVQLVGQYPAILGVVLANISHPSREIVEVSRQANDALLNLAPADPNQESLQLDTGAILATISAELLRGTLTPAGSDADPQVAVAMAVQTEPSRLEALRWVHFLLDRAQTKVLVQLPTILPALLDALLAHSETVVEAALGVFAAIASCPGQFRPVLGELLGRFRGDTGALLLQRGGALVIRRLCGFMGAEAVFTELAGTLHEEPDLTFAATMVQALNLILLTSPEVRGLREKLRGAAAPLPAQPSTRVAATPEACVVSGRELQQKQHQQGPALFAALYPCWAHSSGALLSLCLLAQAYDHAYEVIQCYRWLPMGTEVLVQMDRLVQLLDTPTFTFLRLQLLQPRQHAALLRALYALLQLLPQSNAFRLLSMRLQAMPWHALMQMDGLEPFPPLAAAADAHAASAPCWEPPHKPTPPTGAAPEEQSGPVCWEDLDLPAMLRCFCAKQQRHYLVEVGLEEQAALTEDSIHAALGPFPSVYPGSSHTLEQAGALTGDAGTGLPPAAAPTNRGSSTQASTVSDGGEGVLDNAGRSWLSGTEQQLQQQQQQQQGPPAFGGDSFSSEAFWASGHSTVTEAGAPLGGTSEGLAQGNGSSTGGTQEEGAHAEKTAGGAEAGGPETGMRVAQTKDRDSAAPGDDGFAA